MNKRMQVRKCFTDSVLFNDQRSNAFFFLYKDSVHFAKKGQEKKKKITIIRLKVVNS